MNRPAELHEYVAIMRQYMLEESRSPEYKHRFRKQVLQEFKSRMDRELREPTRAEKNEDGEVIDERAGYPNVREEDLKYLTSDPAIADMEEFIKSDAFVDEAKKQYVGHVQQALVDKEHFKLVDALEMTLDFWNYGQNLMHYPTANTYIPVRNTIMKKPNLLNEDDIDDELGYQYNTEKDKTRMRFHPMEQLNPMRGNRMGPGPKKLLDPMWMKKEHQLMTPTTFSKWRRLSKIHDRSFSTAVRPRPASTLYSQAEPLVKTSQSGITLPEKLRSIPDLMTAFSPFKWQ